MRKRAELLVKLNLPDHFVQRNAPCNNRRILAQVRHVSIHFLVHQPERNSLVTDQCLIVTLGIGNALLAVSTIYQCVDDVAHVPFVITLVFQQFDPHIRDSHRKTVVETNTSSGNIGTKKRHTRDVLGDSDTPGEYFVHSFICLRGDSSQITDLELMDNILTSIR